MSDLRPCPFCGSEDVAIGSGPVFCWSCKARGPTAALTHEGWNRRDPDPHLEGVNAGLAMVSEWLDAAGVPRGPKGHGVAETVQARLAGLAALKVGP